MWRTAVNTEAVQEAIAGRTDATSRRRSACSASRSPAWPTRCATPRRGSRASTRSRSPPACAAARSRWSRATSPTRADVYEELVALLARAPRARDLLRGRLARGRPGGCSCSRDGGSATAESCTAGLLAARLTERPGSSAYVAGGVVAYANEAKVELLDVDPQLIEEHGAVSEPVAEAMAEGALKRFEADTAVAITGIAGPDGGTEEKPVGTVCWSVRLADGRGDHADGAAAGRPGGHPRPLDHRRDAPAAAPALRARRHRRRPERPAGTDVPGARPAGARRVPRSPRWRDALVAGRGDLRPVRPEALHVTLVFLGLAGRVGGASGSPSAAFGALPAGRRRGSRPRACARCRRATRACSRSTWRTRAAAPARCRPPRRLRSRPAAGTAREAALLAAHHAGAREAGRAPRARRCRTSRRRRRSPSRRRC